MMFSSSHQFYVRVLIGFVVLGLVLISISHVRSYHLKQQFLQYEQTSQTSHTESRLTQTLENWKNDAQRITNSLNFITRNLATSEKLLISISEAYLNHEHIDQPFDLTLLIDSNNHIIYSKGCSSLIEQLVTKSDHRFLVNNCDNSQSLVYYVIKNTLRTLDDHQLTLYFAKALNHQTLSLISPRQSVTQILLDGQPYPEQLDAEAEKIRSSTDNFIELRINWPYEPEVMLQIHKPWPQNEHYWILFIPPLIALSAAFVIIWFSFGAWSRKNSRDITQLNLSAQRFADKQDLASSHAELASLLDEKQPTETNQLAQAFSKLMHRVSALLQQEKSFTETLTLLDEAVITLDAQGQIIDSSSGWQKLTRNIIDPSQAFLDYLHPDDRDGWLMKLNQLIQNDKQLIHIRFRLNTPGQAHPWIEGKFLGHRTELENAIRLRGALRDVTQSYLHEQQITHMALHDALTGIANRLLLEDRLKQAIQLADRHQRQLAILFFDLDHFKQINDSLGHKVGDQLLIAVSQRIQSQIRAVDTLARWGGDEFVILFSDINTLDMKQITDKLMQSMKQSVDLAEHELIISFSMGVAVYPKDASDIQELFAKADRAMFHAKNQGRNQVCFFADMHYADNAKKELYLQTKLIDALNKNRLDVHYQPIVDSLSQAVVSVEALARWTDDHYGQVSPATFIPMIENSGMSAQFGDFVIIKALDTLSIWNQQGLEVRMSINVSSRQLFSGQFVARLLSAVTQRQLDVSQVILEITESLALRDIEHAIEHLVELRKLGFKVSIDDFGTGHSSLAQLQEISADKLKIDRRFIHQLNTEKGYAMVKAIQNMAYALGLKTVAEGVETATQQMIVKQLGISYIQGYYYAKPMDAQHCFDWIKEHNDKLKTM